MEIDPNIPSYTNWLFGGPETSAAVVMFGGVVLVVSLLALFIGWLAAVFRHGPGRGTAIVGGSVSGGLIDLIRISPRRIYGLAWLAAREAFRRRIWVVLVIFALILMFAGWFLNPNTDSPAQLYLSFVLTSTTFLVLLLALFLSVFSLPNDIKNKTIYTVATKPVRASEIVLGRVLGFSAVGTLFLLAMAAASYLFVATSLRHTHELLDEDLIAVREQGEIVAYTGLTSNEKNHRHEVTIDLRDFSPGLTVGEAADDGGLRIDYVGYSAADAGIRIGDVLLEVDGKPAESGAAESLLLGMAGSEVDVKIASDGPPQEHTLQRVIANFETGSARDHTHPITALWEGEQKLRYEIGREQGMLNARVPMWGQLRFRNPQGDAADASSWQFDERGINVGKMWTYRSYIRGNTLAAAIWTFDDVSETEYPDGLPLDMDIRVFRGHKGDIRQGITGSLRIRNPDTGVASRERIFVAQEFEVDRIHIPRTMTSVDGAPLDLFKDLVTEDGRVEVWLRCVNPGQYFGMAQADVYIRAPDASYTMNFIKGFAGIWLQMVMITAMGVLFSTFLSGPVGMILTLSAILVGFFTQDIANMTLSVLDPDRSAAEVEVINRYYGGGPVEAFYRIITQKNLTADLELPVYGKVDDKERIEKVDDKEWNVYLDVEAVIKTVDYGVMWCMEKVLLVLPDLSQFDNVERLAHGFVIWPDTLLRQMTTALAFILCSYVASCFILRSRELAA